MTIPNESPAATDRRDETPPVRFDRADFDVVLGVSAQAGRPSISTNSYRHRDLFTDWTLRNLKARHAQSALGLAWAVIQPIVSTVIFTVVFGTLVGVASDNVPYPLFALVGMVFWTYYSNAVREGVSSLTTYTGMLSKIYFPRLILPLSAVLGKLLDLVVGSSSWWGSP